jgi:hypothetical protein
MRNHYAAVVLCGLALTSHFASAQTNVCDDIVTQASHNIGITSASSDYLNSVFKNYCRSDGSTNQSALNAGIGIPIADIPVSLTLGSSDATTSMTNFCKNYSSSTQASSSTYSAQSTVVDKAITAAVECMKIAASGNLVTYQIVTPQTMIISFTVGSGNTVQIGGISHPSNVACVGASDKPLGGTISYDAGTRRSLNAGLGGYKVTCTRTGKTDSGGRTMYAESAVAVSTNNGGMNIYWPQDTVLPLTDADQIQTAMVQLTNQLNQTNKIATDAQTFNAKMSTNANQDYTGSDHVAGNFVNGASMAYCKPGSYLVGLTFNWSGTCNNQCNGDGAILKSIIPICRFLVQ